MRQSSYTRETFQLLKMSKKLTIFVDGPYGIAEGKIIWMAEKDIVFWCREELRLGSRPRARVDIGTGKQIDIEIHVREHLVPEITQIPKGYVFVGRYSLVSKADEPSLLKMLRRINPDMLADGTSGSGSVDSSYDSREKSSSQSFDSSVGLKKKESQELMLWHLGRKKRSRSRKTTKVMASGQRGKDSPPDAAPIRASETPREPEPTDPAERMRVAQEALKETAVERRPLFDSVDEPPPEEAEGDQSGEQGSSSELRAPLKAGATRTQPLPGISKAPPRKGKAHRALSQSVDALRARATSESPIKKKATESSAFGFKRDFTIKKKKRTRKMASSPGDSFKAYIPGTIAPGTASVLIQFDDPGRLLACMRKKGSKLWFSIQLDQKLVVGTTLNILVKLPDSTMTQFQARICEVHDTHSVLAVDSADSTQVDIIRGAMGLD